MTAVAYPTSLPGPSVSAVTPAERRLLSDVTGGPQQARGIQRDYLAQQRVEWTNLNATEALALDDWYNTTLNFGGAWFSSTWPAPQGWVALTRRFIGVPVWTHHSGTLWNVSSEVLVRGRTAAPNLLPPVLSFVGVVGNGVAGNGVAGNGVIVLRWASSNATSVTLAGTPVSLGGSAAGAENTSYTLTATNSAGTTSVTITTPYLPPYIVFTGACVYNQSFHGAGYTSLNWTITNSTSQSISTLGVVTASGSSVDLDPLLTYTLTAIGPGGTATASVGTFEVHWENLVVSGRHGNVYRGTTPESLVPILQSEENTYWATYGGAVTGYSIDPNPATGQIVFAISNGIGAAYVPLSRRCGSA